MEAKIPLAFVAGLVSFATPCVLPLVPGYLAVVSGQEAGVGGRRVVLASLPFVAGFTAVFVALGAAVAAAGSLFLDNRELFLAVALVRWSRARPEAAEPEPASANGGPPLDPELERRLDEELARYDG